MEDDFDDETIYRGSMQGAEKQETRNFVVEFGKDEVRIALNMDVHGVRTLLKNHNRPGARPVRWFNIWGPNQQTDLVGSLGTRYKFSPRLLAIIKSKPLPEAADKIPRTLPFMARLVRKDDVESAMRMNSVEQDGEFRSQKVHQSMSHFCLAEQMINYQSIDVGAHYLCIGANWLHEVSMPKTNLEHHTLEHHQRRLWTWLILCDDDTVISLHEDTGPCTNEEDLKSMRGNTLSVLSQLSNVGHKQADPISMQTVRQVLESDEGQVDPGIEGASNLFYYLFDDWRAVYTTVSSFHNRLDNLQKYILDMPRKSTPSSDVDIIPQLHILGQQIRQRKHLYEGYKNLIDRILKSSSEELKSLLGVTTPPSVETMVVQIASSARRRFERLGDRIQLLILSETLEFLAEKDALISTYFNITAQKDSEATARLTRSATLLAKLSVLFLPVSLMTAYFSTQVQGVDGFTANYYWTWFGIIVSVSFLFLFFFARLLMFVTETLDSWAKNLNRSLNHVVAGFWRSRGKGKAAD